jgi:UDP-glucose 4-epimerase
MYMKTVCITGIGGYLGLATAYKLVEVGYKVVGIGSSPIRPDSLPVGVVYAGIDIRDVSALAEFFTKHEVSAVYHFAAIKYVGKCEADPVLCYEINTKGTEAVLAAMKIAAVPHIVYASTYAVYDWSGDIVTLTENTPTKPATVYGNSKLQSEAAIMRAYEVEDILRYHILRYGNIVGAVPELPIHTPQSFLDKMVVATKTGETITLNGGDYSTKDGTVARDFIDVRDVVQVNQLVLTQSESAIYNVSSGVATTLKELIDLCEVSSETKITLTVNPETGSEPSSITIDSSKLAWQPIHQLSSTVKLLLEKLTS